jgi:hypothetical protein
MEGWLIGIPLTYWPMNVSRILKIGKLHILFYFIIAVRYQSLVSWWFIRRLNKIIYQE